MTPREDTRVVEDLSLDRAATLLLEDRRMVLPGIQALFGFQFVAVFNSGFSEKLSHNEQLLHLGALLCVLIATAGCEVLNRRPALGVPCNARGEPADYHRV